MSVRTRPLARRLLLPIMMLAIFPLGIGTFATVQVRRIAAQQAADVANLRARTTAVTDLSAALRSASDLLIEARLDDRILPQRRVDEVTTHTDLALRGVRRQSEDPAAPDRLAALDDHWHVLRDLLTATAGAVPSAADARATLRHHDQLERQLVGISDPLVDEPFHTIDGLLLVARVMPFAMTVGVLALTTLVGLTARRMRRLVLEPLAQMRAAAWRLADGDYSARVDLEAGRVGDEFGHVAGVFDHMVERLQAAHRDLRHRALHDPLTELPHRGQLDTLLESALARRTRNGHVAGVLALDLDGFKLINDTLGHAAGDDVLCAVASRLRTSVRRGDDVLRLGGDEFLVLLTGRYDHEVRVAARRIVREVVGTVGTRDGPAEIDVSGGLAICPLHADAAEDLCRRADVAMYHAKATGQALVVYDRRLDATSDCIPRAHGGAPGGGRM